jgi:D-mannonate dehydratase
MLDGSRCLLLTSVPDHQRTVTSAALTANPGYGRMQRNVGILAYI